MGNDLLESSGFPPPNTRACHPEPALPGEGPFSWFVGNRARERHARAVLQSRRPGKDEIRGSFALKDGPQDDRPHEDDSFQGGPCYPRGG